MACPVELAPNLILAGRTGTSLSGQHCICTLNYGRTELRCEQCLCVVVVCICLQLDACTCVCSCTCICTFTYGYSLTYPCTCALLLPLPVVAFVAAHVHRRVPLPLICSAAAQLTAPAAGVVCDLDYDQSRVRLRFTAPELGLARCLWLPFAFLEKPPRWPDPCADLRETPLQRLRLERMSFPLQCFFFFF